MKKLPKARVLYSFTDDQDRPLDWFNNIPNGVYKMPCTILPFHTAATAKRFARIWNMSDGDMKLIARAPDLLAAVEDLMQIVEGFRGERWAANAGRLVDTPEWCRLYTLRCVLLRSEPNIAGQTAAPNNPKPQR